MHICVSTSIKTLLWTALPSLGAV